jgi:hypothetical protein
MKIVKVEKKWSSSRKCFLSFNKGSDTINHILNELLLRSSESSSVGDIEDTIVGLGVLTVDTSDLNKVFISNRVELIFVVHELWKLDMDGGSESSSKIGWARGDITEMIVMSKLANLLNFRGGSAESVKNFSDSSTLLHGDDSELIFFVDPDEESLGGIMENTSTRWPVSIEIACFEESVSFLEEEMVGNKLVLVFLFHSF